VQRDGLVGKLGGEVGGGLGGGRGGRGLLVRSLEFRGAIFSQRSLRCGLLGGGRDFGVL